MDAAVSRPHRLLLPALLFLACFGAYVGNGDFLYGGDQEANMLFSVNLLKRHSFSLTPADAPDAFRWRLEGAGGEAQGATLDRWSRVAEWNREAVALYEQGQLVPRELAEIANQSHIAETPAVAERQAVAGYQPQNRDQAGDRKALQEHGQHVVGAH